MLDMTDEELSGFLENLQTVGRKLDEDDVKEQKAIPGLYYKKGLNAGGDRVVWTPVEEHNELVEELVGEPETKWKLTLKPRVCLGSATDIGALITLARMFVLRKPNCNIEKLNQLYREKTIDNSKLPTFLRIVGLQEVSDGKRVIKFPVLCQSDDNTLFIEEKNDIIIAVFFHVEVGQPPRIDSRTFLGRRTRSKNRRLNRRLTACERAQLGIRPLFSEHEPRQSLTPSAFSHKFRLTIQCKDSIFTLNHFLLYTVSQQLHSLSSRKNLLLLDWPAIALRSLLMLSNGRNHSLIQYTHDLPLSDLVTVCAYIKDNCRGWCFRYWLHKLGRKWISTNGYAVLDGIDSLPEDLKDKLCDDEIVRKLARDIYLVRGQPPSDERYLGIMMRIACGEKGGEE